MSEQQANEKNHKKSTVGPLTNAPRCATLSYSSMNNINENPTANQFQNWSITHFNTLVDMYETFKQDCPDDPDAHKGLGYFIEYMYENAQDVVATWHNPNKYENN